MGAARHSNPCWRIVFTLLLLILSTATTNAFTIGAGIRVHQQTIVQPRVVSSVFHQPTCTEKAKKKRRRTVARSATGVDSGGNAERVRLPSTGEAENRPYNKQKSNKGYKKSFNQNKRYNNPKNNFGNKWKTLNRQLVQCEQASEMLKLLQSTPSALTKRAGGGSLNMVNFSTSLHRLARHSLQQGQRALILTDARFALLLAAMAEAVIPRDASFTTRELSNIGWALVKLKIVPPSSALPLSMSIDETQAQMEQVTNEIRRSVLEAAKSRRNGEEVGTPWVPLISKLAGILLDHIRLNLEKTAQLGTFQQQEISNLLWSFSTSERAEEEVFGKTIMLLLENQKTLDEKQPQNWSNSIWATATAQVYNGHEDLLDFLADSMTTDQDFLDRFKPQELGNTVWAVASLLSNKPSNQLTEREEKAALQIVRAVAQQAAERAHLFNTQEIANTIWALATLGFGSEQMPEHLLNNYIVVTSDDLQGDRQQLKITLDALVSAALVNVHRARSQELNNMSWGLARLLEDESERTPDMDQLLHAIGMHLSNPRRKVSTQDIGTTLWSFATLQFIEPDIYRNIAARLVTMDSSRFKPQELSNTLWAMATSEIQVVDDKDAFDTTLLREDRRPRAQDPVTQCCGVASYELMRRPFDFKTQEIKDVLWSFSKLGVRHPNLFRSVAEHLVGPVDGNGQDNARGFADFSPQGIGNLVWSFARQAQLSEDAARRKEDMTTSGANGRLTVYTTSFFDIGETLLQKLFLAIAENGLAAHKELSTLKPQDLSNTCWTFGVLGLKHNPFLEAATTQLRLRISRYLSGEANSMTMFKGQELSNLLWACAVLDYPAGDLIDRVSVYLEKLFGAEDGSLPSAGVISKYFKRQELANIAWSCAVFNCFPERLIRILYAGLIGSGAEQDPAILAELFGDGGLQSQEVMTMIYVHLSLLQNGGIEGLSLPPDFPGEYQFGFNPTVIETDTFDLQISTSKVQRDVSAAFNRIGFDHCLEHIISMKDLSEEYGFSDIPPIGMEILSIDIADVEARIAIEVDGPAHYLSKIDQGLETKGYSKIVSRGKLEYQFGWDGERQDANGPTTLKTRIMRKLGWKLISIPFWEWYDLDGDKEAEDAYCRRLLEE